MHDLDVVTLAAIQQDLLRGLRREHVPSPVLRPHRVPGNSLLVLRFLIRAQEQRALVVGSEHKRKLARCRGIQVTPDPAEVEIAGVLLRLERRHLLQHRLDLGVATDLERPGTQRPCAQRHPFLTRDDVNARAWPPIDFASLVGQRIAAAGPLHLVELNIRPQFRPRVARVGIEVVAGGKRQLTDQ